jgi:hypothetical protein
MSTPDFGDTVIRVGDYLRYPRRMLIQVLESGFSSPKFFNSTGNPFLYVKDEVKGDTAETSKIEIADGWTNELDKTDPRPIILCQRDTLTFEDTSINAFKGIDLPGGLVKRHADLIKLPLNFLCFSRIDTEADELALTVGLFFRLFRDHLRNNSKLFKMSSPVIGNATPVRTDAKIDLFSVPVSLTTEYTIVWKVTWTVPKQAKDFVSEIDTVVSAG